MTAKERLEKLDVCVYMQPWWLNIVAGDSWDVLFAERGGNIQGVWVYVTQKKKYGKVITIPVLSKYHGIKFFYPENQKRDKKYSFELRVTADLQKQLPKVKSFNQTFSPSFSNHLSLFWSGYEQTTKYTYLLESDIYTKEELWNGFSESTRRQIRKSEKTLVIRKGDDVDVLSVNQALFKRKSMMLPFDKHVVTDLVQGSVNREQGIVLNAILNDKVVASAWFIWDKSTMYYQGGSTYDEFTDSGAMSLVLWSAIILAQEKKLSFDFEGSMIPSIERFFRGFGAKQTPYYFLKKETKILQIVRILLNK